MKKVQAPGVFIFKLYLYMCIFKAPDKVFFLGGNTFTDIFLISL